MVHIKILKLLRKEIYALNFDKMAVVLDFAELIYI